MEFPLHEGDIRLKHPEIKDDQTGDAFPCPEDYAIVKEIPLPNFDPTKQKCNLIFPIEINGIWTMQFSICDLTQEEIDENEQSKLNSLPEVLRKKGSTPNAI